MTQTTLLVFARSAGLLFRAPGFTHPAVPTMVRLALALGLAIGVAPGVHACADMDLARLSIAITGEVAIGAAMGIGASLLYDGAYYGGRMIDDYVGFRGSVPNAAVTSAQGFGRLWSSLFLAGFFLLDGDAVVIRAFAGTVSVSHSRRRSRSPRCWSRRPQSPSRPWCNWHWRRSLASCLAFPASP
jgi:flagellar biosynthesis protein FliR